MTASIPAVLVVEDEPLILFCTADDFREEGFTVYEARDADEALVALEEHIDMALCLQTLICREE